MEELCNLFPDWRMNDVAHCVPVNALAPFSMTTHMEVCDAFTMTNTARASPCNRVTLPLPRDRCACWRHQFFADSSQILSNGSTARSTPVPPSGMGMSLPHGLDVFGLVDLPDSLLVHQPPLSTSPLAGQSGQSSREERAHWSPSRTSLSPSRRTPKS